MESVTQNQARLGRRTMYFVHIRDGASVANQPALVRFFCIILS